MIRKLSESTNAHFDSRLQQHEKTLAKTEYDKAFLGSLWYPDSHAREEGIKDAHAKTFEWLLDDSNTALQPWDNFVAWLEGGQGSYWISGKAGSGKSTLIRYVCDNDRTTTLLRVWGGSRELLLVKFFFWKAGSSVQKTITGLLRSLLYQVFSALPKLIGTLSTANESPASQYGALPAWTEARLSNCLRILLSNLANSHRICLFLDGLDELDQSYEQVLSLVRNLLRHSNVKICLSSRPYRVFSDALSSSAMLRLHYLTEADIRRYVTESLLPKSLMPILEDSGATFSIPDTIVGRADGVFLWAELVVREVNRGIANEDNQLQLKYRLDSLPDEIEQLYSYMLESIDAVYKVEAARCLALVLKGSCSLLQLSLLIHEGHANNHPLAFADLSAAQTLDLCNSTARRLPTTCAGLLEIQNIRKPDSDISLSDLARRILPSQFAVPDIDPDEIPQELLEILRIRLYVQVRFVHRTALDFLKNSVGMKFMKDYDKYAVHKSVSHLNTLVATWRFLGCESPYGYISNINNPYLLVRRNFAMRALTLQAIETERITATAQSVLWNYVERATKITNSQYLTNLKDGSDAYIPHCSCMIKPASKDVRWVEKSVTPCLDIKDLPQRADRTLIRASDVATVVVSSMPKDFLGFAAFYGLSLYVQYRVRSEQGLQSGESVTYLLACFVSNVVWNLNVNPTRGPNELVDARPQVEFVCGLIDRGADPNAVTASSTIWGDFLERLYSAYHENRMGGTPFSNGAWALMTMAFLDKGANTARAWNLRSRAIWTMELKETHGTLPDVRNFKSCWYGFNGSFSTFTILHNCLNGCDEWACISKKLIAPHNEGFSKCTHFHFADRLASDHYGTRWGPFVRYPISDQQSEDFLRIYEQVEPYGLFDTKQLVGHVLNLRRELEAAASGAGTRLVESHED